jgi:hypothetical protein
MADVQACDLLGLSLRDLPNLLVDVAVVVSSDGEFFGRILLLFLRKWLRENPKIPKFLLHQLLLLLLPVRWALWELLNNALIYLICSPEHPDLLLEPLDLLLLGPFLGQSLLLELLNTQFTTSKASFSPLFSSRSSLLVSWPAFFSARRPRHIFLSSSFSLRSLWST